ncbi:MAG: hypothetical protein ABL908_05595 [Hyphomicrobium sp.]
MAIARKPAHAANHDPVWYGSTASHGMINENNWIRHNSAETWSDAGASESAVELRVAELVTGVDQIVSDMRAGINADMQVVIADQVKEAIHEYASSMQFELAIVDGELCIAVDLRNDVTWIKSYVPLSEVLKSAQKQATSDPVFLRAMQSLVGEIMTDEPRPSEPQPRTPRRASAPIRPVADGAALAQAKLDGFGAPAVRRGGAS